VHEYLDAGDTIVAIGEYHGTYKSTGKSMSAAFAHVYDLRDGRITRFRQFTDTAMLRAAMV
jgi:ketosteroid isomerase-like protein